MEKYISIRNRLMEVLEEAMTKPSFEAWAKPIRIYKIDDDLCIAYFAVPEIPGRNILQVVSILKNRYQKLLEDSMAVVMTKDYRVIIKPLWEYEQTKKSGDESVQKEAEHVDGIDTFMPQYTFDSFVVGEENRFAHAAALAVANSPAEAFNPVYIYGSSGLGKTHLLHAIGNHLRITRPELTILYISAENFASEFIFAIKKNRTYEFKQKYRNIDVLLIDDIQFFGRAKESQEEFFHTFNALYQAKKQIVISSDCEPEKLDNLQERLRTRFAWNMIADIQVPAFETRVAILMKHAELKGLEITPETYEVMNVVADAVNSNVRELEGAFTRIINYSELLHENISTEFAKSVLKNIFKEKDIRVTPQKIKKIVGDHYHLKSGEMESDRRQKNIAEARQIAMYLTRELLDLSLPKIGENFGGKHHTTVLHACKHVEKMIENSLDFKEMVEALRKEIVGKK